LWAKGIGLGIGTVSRRPDGTRVEYTLMGSVGTDSLTWISPRHPEYQIGGPTACTSCKMGWVKFTPFADPRDISRLSDINFSCITRWRPCTEQADILPTAWKEMKAQKTATIDDFYADFNACTPPVIRVLSREAHRLVFAGVIKKEHDPDGDAITLREIPEGVPQHPDPWRIAIRPSFAGVRLGERLLMLDNMQCPAARATEENLIAARLGTSEGASEGTSEDPPEGWASPPHRLAPPFDTFKPPKIDVR
jgi:hypothetical protein